MPSTFPRRTIVRALAAIGLLPAAACHAAPAAKLQPRTWRMGFSHNPPRPYVKAVIEGINLWSKRADMAIIHDELPWAALLAGESAEAILQRDKLELVKYLRSKRLGLAYMLDTTNGLERREEAPALVKAGRSLTEPTVQALAVSYALAVEAMLRPQWLGLAAETNLVRMAAPPKVYRAVKDTAGAIEAALAKANARSVRFVSIQAEVAWGRLLAKGSYVGIAQDLKDFPFSRVLGISSYPYFGFDQPEDIPLDYYARLGRESGLPVLVCEGGWTSAGVGAVISSPDEQARNVARQAQLLERAKAIGWFQLVFADIDMAAFPGPLPSNLQLFTQIGLTDADFRPKPALAAWDSVFARKWAGQR